MNARAQPLRKADRIYWALLALFFVSGASGLIYQALWLRLLNRVFGSTVFTVAVIVSAFMAGLGLGSWCFGRWIDRDNQPTDKPGRKLLLLYSALELALALTAVIYLFLFESMPGLAAPLYRLLGGAPLLYGVVRILLIYLLLLLPATLMGATLPVLCKWVIGRGVDGGRGTGSLYALNTLGAATGAFLTDFSLVPQLGIRGAALCGVGINCLAGLGAWIIYLRADQTPNIPAATPVREAQSKIEPAQIELPRQTMTLILFAFGVSGFCALGYETLWTRIMLFFSHSQIYAFSLMLSIYLAGIALGSWICGRHIDRARAPLNVLILLQAAIAVFALLSLPASAHAGAAGEWLNSKLAASRGGWLDELSADYLRLALIIGCIVFPATCCFGAMFPAVNRLLLNFSHKTGEQTGKGYAWNCIGSIFGSLAAGLLILPHFGAQNGILLLALINLALALLLAFAHPAWRAGQRLALALPLAAVFAFTARLPADYLLGSTYRKKFGELLHFEEGLNQTLAVRETRFLNQPVAKLLITDGYNMSASNFRGLRYMRLMAHLPAALHPAPRRALVVCFGIGNTFQSMTLHRELEAIDMVELAPEVIRVAPLFSPDNETALADPRVNLLIRDGRNHLLTTDAVYDLITAEPPPPTCAGIVNLYSREYFALCRKRLSANGIVCHWLPIDQIPAAVTQEIIAAFHAEFPYTQIWSGYYFELLLIGSPAPITIGVERFQQLFADRAIAANLRDIGLTSWAELAATFAKDTPFVARYTNGVRPLTDNFPDLEYSTEFVAALWHDDTLYSAPEFPSRIRWPENAERKAGLEQELLAARQRMLANLQLRSWLGALRGIEFAYAVIPAVKRIFAQQPADGLALIQLVFDPAYQRAYRLAREKNIFPAKVNLYQFLDLFVNGRDAEAERWLEQTQPLDSKWLCHLYLAAWHNAQGRAQQERAQLRRALECCPDAGQKKLIEQKLAGAG